MPITIDKFTKNNLDHQKMNQFFNSVMEQFDSWKKELFESTNIEVAPAIFIISQNEKGKIINIFTTEYDNSNPESKMIFQAHCRQALKQLKAERYAVISEAWRSNQSNNSNMRPSKCSDREEVYVFNFVDKKVNLITASAPIIRNESGSISRLDEMNIVKIANYQFDGGWLTDLLKPA